MSIYKCIYMYIYHTIYSIWLLLFISIYIVFWSYSPPVTISWPPHCRWSQLALLLFSCLPFSWWAGKCHQGCLRKCGWGFSQEPLLLTSTTWLKEKSLPPLTVCRPSGRDGNRLLILYYAINGTNLAMTQPVKENTLWYNALKKIYLLTVCSCACLHLCLYLCRSLKRPELPGFPGDGAVGSCESWELNSGPAEQQHLS